MVSRDGVLEVFLRVGFAGLVMAFVRGRARKPAFGRSAIDFLTGGGGVLVCAAPDWGRTPVHHPLQSARTRP